ncbi:MAG: nitroreductase family protein [Nitrososphaerota archaeon]|jgi:nitroreductase|nr:nitroreductase family protein [Nitrososphaerota archaeon]
MELDVCIKGRRSVREYTQEPIAKEQIETILEAGTWAPTGMNRQPWRFIVIENKQLIKLVSDETKELVKQVLPHFATQFNTDQDVICYDAPMLILICSEKDPQWTQINLLDCALAAQNMFLKAYELGLGTCYMGFVSSLNSNPAFLRKLGIPENYNIQVPFIIGHPKTTQGNAARQKPNIYKWIK